MKPSDSDVIQALKLRAAEQLKLDNEAGRKPSSIKISKREHTICIKMGYVMIYGYRLDYEDTRLTEAKQVIKELLETEGCEGIDQGLKERANKCLNS